MDLIPKPDQVASAASNVAHKVLYGGLADLRPMPRTLIDDGPLREVYHYRPQKTTRESGDPVLLVTPLAAPAICFDLRRGCSLVEHLVQQGRRTYLVEYGQISFKNRGLGIEHWVEEVIPEAVKAVSEHAGGRPVHLVGWSLGGIFATLVAADRADLPIASLTVLGSPFDVEKVPLVAPLRPILKLTDGGLVTRLYRLLGGAPRPLVRRAFQLSSGTKLVTKPIATLQHLDDTEWLAQIEAVDRFTANMIAYPGRSFGQLYHRMLKNNQLLTGRVQVGDREVAVADVTAPVLVFAGNTDGIAPINAVRALIGLLTSAPEVRFEIVPGGHLGMLTGRAARTTTWVVLDEWLDEHATPDAPPRPARKTARKKTTAKKTTAEKATTKKAATKKAATKKAATKKPASSGAPDRTAIGSNPDRRFASASSRNLARKP
ncbi:polyhydroxyalkanoate synthase [Nocardioides scoriae]|uniref:Polyhydroxyalkanoate synthase n=1 Tax=Nocardioides scoriae TaxID=642780 RepID=A0A1H1X727_9ACTN|nr:alpha/beta fold hydrolase [Nocardioides scoriae]SDT05128.1 polyhydroxyalkanoate synthase [Nocardioides scoriae]